MKNPALLRHRVPVESRVYGRNAAHFRAPGVRRPTALSGCRSPLGLSAALLCLLAAALILLPVPARAQVFAQLGPAEILESDVKLGAFGLAGDHQIGGLVDIRFLLTLGMDFGLQVGARHFSDAAIGETVFDGGIDLRYGLVEESESMPFDMSIGAGFGLTSGDDLTVLNTALYSGVSKRLSTSRGRDITPYASLVLTIAHTKVDVSGGDSEFSNPDVDVALRLGLAAALSGASKLTGELQIKEESTVYLGLATSF